MQWTWRRSTGKWKSWSYWTILTLSSFTRYCIIINVRIVCIYNTFVIMHQLPMQAIWKANCHLYWHLSHETTVESRSFIWVLYRVSLVMLCKIIRSLWAWMLKVSTAACAVTQHKYSISSSPVMTSTRGSAPIVICLSGIRHYT